VRLSGWPQNSPIRSARSKSGASGRGAAQRGERGPGLLDGPGAVVRVHLDAYAEPSLRLDSRVAVIPCGCDWARAWTGRALRS